jgi:hypothetical protein
VASAATTVTSATAATGLRARGKKAAGKHRGCQNHHHSSSHDILHWVGRTFPPQVAVRRWRVSARQSPTSRWTGDGISYLSSLLNSLSIFEKSNTRSLKNDADQNDKIDSQE